METVLNFLKKSTLGPADRILCNILVKSNLYNLVALSSKLNFLLLKNCKFKRPWEKKVFEYIMVKSENADN